MFQNRCLALNERALAVICWLAVAFIPVFTALGAIPGLEYVPTHKGAWLVCVAVLLAVALWADDRKGHWLLLMPVLSVAVLRLFIPVEGMGLWQCILALADLILGGALSARAKTGRKLKMAVRVLSILLLIPTLSMMLLTSIIGTGGIALRHYPYPNGYYEAEVRVVDGGATGGSTIVTVYRPALDLPFGNLRLIRGKTTLGWIDPSALEVAWVDEDTISINGWMWHWRDEGVQRQEVG